MVHITSKQTSTQQINRQKEKEKEAEINMKQKENKNRTKTRYVSVCVCARAWTWSTFQWQAWCGVALSFAMTKRQMMFGEFDKTQRQKHTHYYGIESNNNGILHCMCIVYAVLFTCWNKRHLTHIFTSAAAPQKRIHTHMMRDIHCTR